MFPLVFPNISTEHSFIADITLFSKLHTTLHTACSHYKLLIEPLHIHTTLHTAASMHTTLHTAASTRYSAHSCLYAHYSTHRCIYTLLCTLYYSRCPGEVLTNYCTFILGFCWRWHIWLLYWTMPGREGGRWV